MAPGSVRGRCSPPTKFTKTLTPTRPVRGAPVVISHYWASARTPSWRCALAAPLTGHGPNRFWARLGRLTGRLRASRGPDVGADLAPERPPVAAPKIVTIQSVHCVSAARFVNPEHARTAGQALGPPRVRSPGHSGRSSGRHGPGVVILVLDRIV